jgi:predicted small lipoprotein YifL
MKRLTTLLAALLFFASGCGQSGPLYIPGNPTRIEQPPAAEQSADEEAEENGDSESDKN